MTFKSYWKVVKALAWEVECYRAGFNEGNSRRDRGLDCGTALNLSMMSFVSFGSVLFAFAGSVESGERGRKRERERETIQGRTEGRNEGR